MRNSKMLIALAMLCFTTALVLPYPIVGADDPGAAPLRKHLTELYAKEWKLVEARDYRALEAYWRSYTHPDWIWVSLKGTRIEFEEGVRSTIRAMKVFQPTNPRLSIGPIRFAGGPDYAVYTATIDTTIVVKDAKGRPKKKGLRDRVRETWIKTLKGWRLIYSEALSGGIAP